MRYKIPLLIIFLFSVSFVYAQVVVPFAVKYQTNDKGTIHLVGNTLMTCPAGGCSGVNNSYSMKYVDVDGNASTFNSSTANFTVPTGGSVLWAGLYWGGVPTSGAKQNVKFKAPGMSSYQNLTGTVQNSSYGYSAFKDVTALVQAAGTGTYTVADVASETGTNRWAGWSLVVVVRDPALPMRNLTVFDGLALVSSSTPNVNIGISGFKTPPAGPVNVELGVVAYDGDNSYTGDVFKLNGTTVSNGLNPSSDFFNSSITRLGAAITAKNPNYANQLGLDIDVVNATGIIANSATSATINLTTGGESYLPVVVTSAIDLFSPDISTTKSLNDINGGNLVPGDTVLYTISLINNGLDGATNLVMTDSVRAYQQYVPGSMKIVSGANAGNKTDAAGDDQAEFTAGKAIFRLATGANTVSGGLLSPTGTTVASFRVVITDPIPDSALITNTAEISYSGQTDPGKQYSGASPSATVAAKSVADLNLTKTVNNASPVLDGTVIYTVTVNNAGPNQATNVSVNDLLPAGLLYLSSTPSQGSYNNLSGLWTIGSINSGASVSLQISVKVTGTSAITNIAEVKSSDQDDPDSTPNNNQAGEDDRAGVTITPLVASDLAIRKTASPASPNVGDTVTYRLRVKNTGPANGTGIVVKDSLPVSGVSYVSHTTTQGSFNTGAGLWNVGSLANGDSAILTIKAIMLVATPVTNVAGIIASDQTDPNTSDRWDSVTVPQQVADVSLDKSVSSSTPMPGANITYTVNVANAGPNSATGLIVSDLLPAGLTFVSSTVNKGTYSHITGEWTIGTVVASDTARMDIVATVSGTSPIKNVAQVTHLHQLDPDVADQKDSVTIQAQLSDLSLTKTVSDSLPADGATITYTLTVHNDGPAQATGVQVTDILPSGLIYQSQSASHGSYDTSNGLWNIGTLNSGANATLQITCKVQYANFNGSAFTLGAAAGFNLFVLNDLIQPSADTEGKLAVGRDATLSNYSVGNRLPASGGTTDVLVVGRNLTYTSGGIWGGNVVYGNASNLPSYAVTLFDGTVRQDTVINFAAAKTYLQNLSTTISGYSLNGSIANDWGKLTLTGTNPVMNVFQVIGSDISIIHTMEINCPSTSVVIVNISGTGMNWHGGLFLNGAPSNNVLFNFYQADTLIINGIDVRGTVLAPFAKVGFTGGVVNGQMICYNMTGLGQFNNSNFIGQIPVDQNIHNTAEITASNQADNDSDPNNGDPDEDDYDVASLRISSLGSGSSSGWTQIGNFANNEIILCVSPDFSGNILAGTLGGKIYRSSDNGVSWVQLNTGMVNAFVWSIAKSKNNFLFASTETGVYRSGDNGNTWNKLTNYPNYDTRALVCDSSGNVYAGAWGFGVFKSTNNGNSWTTAKSGLTSLAISALAVSNENVLYVGNFGDGVLKSTDGGSSWTNLNVGYNFIWSLACADSGEILVGSYGDGLYISQNYGSSWYKSNSIPNSAFVSSITVDSAYNKYISTWLSGIYYIPANTLISRPMGLGGATISSIMYNNKSGKLIAGTTSGKLYMFTGDPTNIKTFTEEIPQSFRLAQNYPNPFNPNTVIRYAVPKSSAVTLKVYDILGREVVTLVNEMKQPGNYEAVFNASGLSSGMYIYTLKADGVSIVKKMLLLK